jgi:hypothetical protein
LHSEKEAQNMSESFRRGMYILRLKEGKYYVGYSSNISRRLLEHKDGNGSEWTKKYHPVDIKKIYYISDSEVLEGFADSLLNDPLGLATENGREILKGVWDGLWNIFAPDRKPTNLVFRAPTDSMLGYDALCIPTSNTFDEHKYTLLMMIRYGIDNVRGDVYCRMSLSANMKHEIKQHIRHIQGRCLKCARKGHMAIKCRYRTDIRGYFLKDIEKFLKEDECIEDIVCCTCKKKKIWVPDFFSDDQEFVPDMIECDCVVGDEPWTYDIYSVPDEENRTERGYESDYGICAKHFETRYPF